MNFDFINACLLDATQLLLIAWTGVLVAASVFAFRELLRRFQPPLTNQDKRPKAPDLRALTSRSGRRTFSLCPEFLKRSLLKSHLLQPMVLKSLGPLYPYFKKYRNSYFVGTLCVLLTNGIWVWFPQVIRGAIYDLTQSVTREKILHYSLQLLAIAAVKGIFQFLTRWIVIGISREIEFDLRNDLFAHLERLSYPYYQRTRTGDIMARATNDLNAVRMLLGPAIMYSREYRGVHRRRAGLHADDQPQADAVRLPAAARRQHRDSVLRPAAFTSASSAFRPCSPTSRRERRRTSPARA